MSTAVMGLCWPLQIPPTPKAVLISLADQANDQGICWPSIPGISKRTCYGRTAVIEALKWLEANDLVSVDRSAAKSNRYTLTVDLFQGGRSGDHHYVYCITHRPSGNFYIGLRSCYCDPKTDDYFGSGKACEWLESVRSECVKEVVSEHETREGAAQSESDLLAAYISDGRCLNRRASSPRQSLGNPPSLFSSPHGPSDRRTVRQANRPPGESSSSDGEPSTVREADQPVRETDPNRQEPSVEPKRKKEKPPAISLTVLVEAGFDEATAAEFIAHKDRVKAPLTTRAWKDHLAESRKAGWSPMAAAEKVMARSWKGFDAKYVANDRGGGATETTYARQMRERTEVLGPGVAAKPPGCQQHRLTVIDTDGTEKLTA